MNTLNILYRFVVEIFKKGDYFFESSRLLDFNVKGEDENGQENYDIITSFAARI